MRHAWFLSHSVVLGYFAAATLAVPAVAQLLVPSARRDIEQGTEAAKQVEQQIGLYVWPEGEAYLGEVGRRLAAAANDPRWTFTFQIVDQEEPNAFALPGGRIYISRGLLALVNREDELAGILAHEITHVTKRHSAHEQRKGILPGLLSLPGNLVGNVVSEDLGDLINAPIDAVGGAWLSHYSRGQETEADRIGIRMAAQAGYDPAALADILARIERAVNSESGKARQFSIFDSHPMTATRLSDIRKRAADLTAAPKEKVALDAASLFAKFDGMWWGENPNQGVFRKDQFVQPTIGFSLTLPAGWKHQNTPRYLISSHPQKEAMLLLGVAEKASEPEAAGEEFVARMRKKARIEPVSTRKASLGEFPAFVATYLDRSGRKVAYLHFVWVTMAGKSYRLIGLGPEKYKETLRDAALTLRPLTDAERSGVTSTRLRTANAQQEEMLERFGKRTGNSWSTDYTALVNGLEAGVVLSEGQVLKIGREEQWSPAGDGKK